MLNHDLADPKAPGSGQHRHEAVQLAVEPHFAKDLAAVALHAAVVIVQLDAGQPADQPVEHARRKHFVPGVVPHLLPAADHVELVGHGRQKTGDFARVVLQVGVERHDQLAAGRMEAGAQRRGLAEIAAEPQTADARIAVGNAPNRLPTSRRSSRRRRRSRRARNRARPPRRPARDTAARGSRLRYRPG